MIGPLVRDYNAKGPVINYGDGEPQNWEIMGPKLVAPPPTYSRQ